MYLAFTQYRVSVPQVPYPARHLNQLTPHSLVRHPASATLPSHAKTQDRPGKHLSIPRQSHRPHFGLRLRAPRGHPSTPSHLLQPAIPTGSCISTATACFKSNLGAPNTVSRRRQPRAHLLPLKLDTQQHRRNGCAGRARVRQLLFATSILVSHADAVTRLTEEILSESIDARTESLISLRELGPPDLVHLLKQATRNPGKQVCDLDTPSSSRPLLTASLPARSLPSCHRCRCLLIRQSCRLHQYPDLPRAWPGRPDKDL